MGRMVGQRQTGRRQAGSGMARNRARASLNWVSQGQRWGRCKVRRRAERVSRPAREKNRRRRVLVVTTCPPRPRRAVQRARLCAITWMASQAAGSAFPGHPRESPRRRIHIMTLREPHEISMRFVLAIATSPFSNHWHMGQMGYH